MQDLLDDLIKHTDDEKADTIAGREKQKGDRKERWSKRASFPGCKPLKHPSCTVGCMKKYCLTSWLPSWNNWSGAGNISAWYRPELQQWGSAIFLAIDNFTNATLNMCCLFVCFDFFFVSQCYACLSISLWLDCRYCYAYIACHHWPKGLVHCFE